MPGDPILILNPVEQAVLERCEQWRTIRELQADLWPEFEFRAVPSTIAFLRRRRMLEPRTDDRDELVRPPMFRQTELGARVLRHEHKRETEVGLRLV